MASPFYKPIRIVIVGSLIVYFIITFIFCLPDNLLPPGFLAPKAKFQALVYQKWGFFKYSAPYNDRLYYVIQDSATGKDVAVVEVFKNLRQAKTRNAPFNQEQIITDIILSRCIAELMAVQSIAIQNLKKANPGYSQMECMQQASKQIISGQQCQEELQTLKNYATIVAKSQNIGSAGKVFKIIIAHKYFNDFDKRKMPDISKEVIVFETTYNSFK